MIISIDGPAGSGKSTVANVLAKKLGFVHFNSGSLYRGITAFLLEQQEDATYVDDNLLKNISLSVKFINGVQHVFVNSKDYTSMLRNNNISVASPEISKIPLVRKIADECQRNFASQNNVVIDGRDIGSFVFPNAEFKFYLDCSVKVRAKRRFAEEKLKNNNVTLEEIEKELIVRDEIDKKKEIAPLVIPKNAVIIDSSTLTVNDVVNKMLSYIKI